MTVKHQILRALQDAEPGDFMTLHRLEEKLASYAHATIQGGLRRLLNEGEITSYEHPSFPHRPIYRTMEEHQREGSAK